MFLFPCLDGGAETLKVTQQDAQVRAQSSGGWRVLLRSPRGRPRSGRCQQEKAGCSGRNAGDGDRGIAGLFRRCRLVWGLGLPVKIVPGLPGDFMVAGAQVPGIALEVCLRQQLKEGHLHPADITPVEVALFPFPGPAEFVPFSFCFFLLLFPDKAFGDRLGISIPRGFCYAGECEVLCHELVEILDGVVGKVFPPR